MSRRSSITLQVLSVLVLLAIWQTAAAMIESRVLPLPVVVLESLAKGIRDGEIPYNIAITLARG